ncbi:MAG: choice-of-anchor D domain-containing protein [Myxococcales bacterium]|nr:choice-of-anchor D domain-containing protein [Myxococcales bacterium]
MVMLIVSAVLGSATPAHATLTTSGNVNFGSRPAGTPDTATVSIYNDASQRSVTVVATCTDVAVSPGSGVVPANGAGSLELTVTWTASPTVRGPMPTCTVSIDGPGADDVIFTVDGTSTAPRLVVAAGDLSFGTARWNDASSLTRALTIDNTGNAPLDFATVSAGFAGVHSGDFTVLFGAETGFPIPPSGSGTITVAFNPSAAGSRTAVFDIETSADLPGESVPNVTATGTGTQAILTFSPTSLMFGAAPVGGSVDSTLSLRNLVPDGASTQLDVASLTIGGVNAAEFTFRDHGCTGLQACTPSSAAIAVGASDTYAFRCRPTAPGLRTATLTVVSNDASSGMPTSSKAVTLNCTGVPPTLAVAPTSVTFAGNNRIGTPATVQTITISNAAGAQALTYAAATSSMTEFPLSCMGGGIACLSGTVPAGGSAQIQVGFVPGAVGARSGMVTLTTNDPDPTDATKVIPLAGTGAISSLSANASLAFGTVDIAASGGVTQNLVLTNTGGMTLNIASMSITSDPGANFTFAFGACTTGQSCGPLAAIAAAPGPGNTLTITLRCDPTTIGAKTGTLNIVSDDPASPRAVGLTCTGSTPDIQIAGPPLADFGSQRINTTSATTRTFTISNPAGTTTSPLTYSVSEGSPHFSIACSAPGCSGTITPGGTAVTVTVSFRPSVTGPLTGTINVASNDVSTPSVDINVTGAGAEPLAALTAPVPPTPPTVGGALTFPDTNVGATSATQTITIQNTGSMTLTVSSVTNTNPADFNMVGPTTTTIAPSGTASWTVACAPDVQGTRTGTIQVANDSSNDTSVDVALSCNAVRGNIVVTSATPFAYTQPTNTIDFGSTFLNQSKMTTVTISNNGNRAVNISAITSAPAAQGFTIGAPSAMAVPAGGSITLPITFMPTLNTQGTAIVTLTTDWNTLAFNVTGDGADSGLVIMKGAGAGCTTGTTTHDYGDVVWSSAPVAQSFCIKNIGQAAAPLTSVALSGANGNYTITGVPGTLPTLLTNQQLDVTVFADPNDTTLGMFTATLNVTSTLPSPDNQKTVALSMRSTGPTIALNPGAAIDFGGVDVDLPDGRIIPLTITNMMVMGAAPLVISSITAPTGPFSLVSPPATVTINSGESTTLMVRYDPTVERSGATMESSSFVINTTGYYVGGVRQPVGQQITLTGYGVDQHIAVRGDGGNPVLTFGDVYRNPRADDPRATKTLQVCNTGEAALTVSMLAGVAAPFTVATASPLTIGAATASGETCADVLVEFRPADAVYQSYSATLTVTNDDDGAAMVMVPLSGASVARPVSAPSALAPTVQVPVGIALRLTELVAAGIPLANQSTPSEDFTVEVRPSDDAAVVVGSASRELAAGETEVYDLTLTVPNAGELALSVDVYLDGDPIPHARIPVTLTAIERQPDDLYGCDAGNGRQGWPLGVVGLALMLRRRRRSTRATRA